MDILYVVGTGSKWGDNELRYSLRSLARFGQNVGRVCLVGYKPDFVADNIEWLDMADPYKMGGKNTYSKVIAAVKHFHLNDFILFNDDFFLIAPCNLAKYPYYCHRGYDELPTWGEVMNSYEQVLADTRAILENAKLPVRRFDCHHPMRFNGKLLLKYEKTFDCCFTTKFGCSVVSFMGNAIKANKRIKLVPTYNCKISNYQYRADLLKFVASKEFLSIGDGAVCSDTEELLQSYFPTKCRYEK